MIAAISGPWLSSAKWPASRRWTSVSGLSRLKASAPAGRKNGSFLPQTARSAGPPGADIFLEFGIQRDVALVVAEQIELDLVIAGSSKERRVQGPASALSPQRRVSADINPIGTLRRHMTGSTIRFVVGRRCL
jgi:hypothetical protein